MTDKKKWLPLGLVIAAVMAAGLTGPACSLAGTSPGAAVPTARLSTPAVRQVKPTETIVVPAEPTSVIIERTAAPPAALQPYPYTTPLPPPTPTILDGVYGRRVKFEGTPVPCRRCAPYRADGGEWTLRLKAGVFRVSHEFTGFQGVGSFTVSGNRIMLFNDPNCHLDVGTYTWRLTEAGLILKVVDDPCAFGLRYRNLTAGPWTHRLNEEARPDLCQPPSTEAAISGHWPRPPGC